MSKRSAGLLMYRYSGGILQVFLAHMGGPYWAQKDLGAWSIPKGELEEGEDNPLTAAKREFVEETGLPLEDNLDFRQLSSVKQPSGKIVIAWAFEGDCDPQSIQSNTFSMEWPPRSGRLVEFPEIDRADWFDISTARQKLVKGQVGFLDELCRILDYRTRKGVD